MLNNVNVLKWQNKLDIKIKRDETSEAYLQLDLFLKAKKLAKRIKEFKINYNTVVKTYIAMIKNLQNTNNISEYNNIITTFIKQNTIWNLKRN